MTEHFHPEDKKMTAKESAKDIGKEAGLQGASELLPGLWRRCSVPLPLSRNFHLPAI